MTAGQRDLQGEQGGYQIVLGQARCHFVRILLGDGGPPAGGELRGCASPVSNFSFFRACLASQRLFAILVPAMASHGTFQDYEVQKQEGPIN